MRRRILVFGHEASRSGAPRLLASLLDGADQLTPKQWQWEVWLRGGGADLPAWQKRYSLQLVADGSEGKTWRARLWRRFIDRPFTQPHRLRRLVAKTPPDHFALIHNNTATNGDLLPLLAPLRCPIVTHVHETTASLRRFVRMGEWQQTLALTTRFIAVSAAVRDDLVDEWGVSPDRVTVVPNFLPCLPPEPNVAEARERVIRQLGLPHQVCLVLAMGHLDMIKGPDLFIEMLRQLKDRSTAPVHGVWLGGVADQRLARRVRRDASLMGLHAQLHWPGPVKNPEEWLAAADIVAVTSREESFSLAALEAAALARPVLIFRGARGPLEVVGEGADLVAPGHDTHEMAERAARLLANPEYAKEVGMRLRRRVAQRFLAEQRVPEILQVWTEVSDGQR